MQIDAALIIRIVIAIIAAVLFGNGSVVAFNRMNRDWFLDYDDSEGADSRGAGSGDISAKDIPKVLPPKLLEAEAAGRQRLPSSPWKYIFVAYFALCGLYLAIRGGSATYEISVLCVLFIMLEMAIADQLYQTVPDQLMMALAVSAIAFIGYHDKWYEPLLGALLGLGISLVILLLGMVLFKTGSLGGADIKFFTCIGLVTGRTGVVIIFILTTLLFAVYSFVRIATKQGTIKDKNAMLPSAAAAVTIYLLFLFNVGDMLVIDL
jgi:Flp pilus assembly protein protease CpaA